MLASIVTRIIAHRFGWSDGRYFASALVLLGMLAWLPIEPTHEVAPQDSVPA